MSGTVRLIHVGREHRFGSYEEVGEHVRRYDNVDHNLRRLTDPSVAGRLLTDGDDQRLHLIGDGREGFVSRGGSGREGGVPVSTAQEDIGYIDIIAHPEPRNSTLLDRGLAWVGISAEVPSFFHVVIKQGHGIDDPAEIAQRLRQAEMAAMELVGAVLDSNHYPPYADYAETPTL